MSQDPFGQLRNQKPGVLGYVDASGTWVALNPGANNTVLAIASGYPAYTASPLLTNLNLSGWLRVGSLVVPTNQTAGDFTAERIWVPDQASSALTGLINGYSNSATVPFVSRMDSSATGAGFRLQSAGVIPYFESIRSAGTIASPTAVTNNLNLLVLAARGFYDTSNVSAIGGQVYLRFISTENWSNTNRGGSWEFGSTANGATTVAPTQTGGPLGMLTAGYFKAGDLSAPVDTTGGVIASTDRIYPGNTSYWYLSYTSSKPTISFDSGDYEDYDRSANKWTFYVDNSAVAAIKTGGIVDAATGFQINGAATSGNVLRGNGTNFVSSALGFGDLSGSISTSQIPDRTRTVSLPIGSATPGGSGVATTADLALRGTNTRYRAFAFDSATAEGVTLEFVVPQDYVSGGAFVIGWTNLGAGAGDVRWQILGSSRVGADDLNAASLEFNTTDIITAPSQNILKISTHSVAPSVAAGEVMTIQVVRDAVPASDTLGNDAGLFSLAFSYTADS